MNGNGRRPHNNKKGAFKNERRHRDSTTTSNNNNNNKHKDEGQRRRDSKRSRQYENESSTDLKVDDDEVLIDESNTPFRQLVGGLLSRDRLSERERKAIKQVAKEIVDGMDNGNEIEEDFDDQEDDDADQEVEALENDVDSEGQDLDEDDEDLDDEEDDDDLDEEDEDDLEGEEDEDQLEEEEGDFEENAEAKEEEEDDDESQIIDESDDNEEEQNAQHHVELSPSDPFLHRLDDRNKKVKAHQAVNLAFEARSSFVNQKKKNKNEEEALDSSLLETPMLTLSGSAIVTEESLKHDVSKAKNKQTAAETSLLKKSHVHPRLLDAWKRYRSRDKDNRGETLSEIQKHLLPFVLSSYSDLGFFARNLTNAVDLREVYALHVLNHVFKARDLVESHDAFINQRTREARATGKPAEFTEEEEQEHRDQGFCRPRVLVVLPFKSSAFKFIKLLLELFPPKTRVRNYERFLEEFGPLPEEDDDEHEQEWRLHQVQKKYSASYKEIDFATGKHPALFSVDEQNDSQKNKKKSKSNKTNYIKSTKPVEWHSVFDENSEEDFRIGIALNSAKSVKLFSSFYQSDIIVASPLGLRLATKQAMEADVHEDGDPTASGTLSLDAAPVDEDEDLKIEGDKKKKRTKSKADLEKEKEDTDFLSSIEVLVMDECDAFHMQNWQHLEDICVGINRRPKSLREEMDFSRVYERLLDSKARLFRQTLLFSSFPDAMINALISRGGLEKEGLFLSPGGAIRVREKSYQGVASQGPSKLVQRFKRVEEDQMKRFEYFVSKVIPKLCRADYGAGILLFVPSYFDFIRIKNALKKEQKQVERELRGAGLLEDDNDDEEEEELDEDGKPKKVYGKRHTKKKVKKTFFETCCEYTSPTNVTRARAKFYYGNTKMLVMTERYYYYFRSRTRGVKRVLFYAPPQHPNFYLEVLDWVGQPSEAESICFFSKLDALELERIVGSKRAKKAIAGELVVAKNNNKQQQSQQDATFSIICQDEDDQNDIEDAKE